MKKLMSLLLLTPFLLNCQSSNNMNVVAEKIDGVVTVDYPSVKDSVTYKLSDLVEDLEYVQLDSAIKHYSNWTRMVSDNYIIAEKQGGSLKLFSRKSGKFIANVGAVGRGSGEYLFAIQCKFHEATQTILVSSFNSSGSVIYIYDINGKFIKHLPLAEANYASFNNFSIDSDGNITILSIERNVQDAKIRIVRQDYEGNELQRLDIENSDNFNTTDIVSSGEGYIAYVINDYKEAKNVSLSRYNFKDNSSEESFNVILDDLNGEQSDTKSTISYFETANLFFATKYDTRIIVSNDGNSVGKTMETRDIIVVDKDNLTGGSIRVEDDIFGYPIDRLHVTSKLSQSPGYFISTIDAITLVETLERLKEERGESLSTKVIKNIDKLISEIDIEGNSVIMYGKLKS